MLVIVGVLGGVLAINWPGSDVESGAYAQRMVSDIRYAQLTAMTCSTCNNVEFVINGNSYSMEIDGTPTPFADGEMVRNMGQLGLTLAGSSINFARELGIPRDNANQALTAPASFNLSDSAICVYHQTGYVEMDTCS
nr:hypothetical protein [Desulfurispirillum indicum]